LKIKPRCYLSSRRKRIVCPFLWTVKDMEPNSFKMMLFS
jgi:hypothetical protein